MHEDELQSFYNGIKQELKQMWADGQRELVILTFKAAASAGDKDFALWIHATFSEDYTDEEMQDLEGFAIGLVLHKLASVMRQAATPSADVNAEQATRDVIAKAMQH